MRWSRQRRDTPPRLMAGSVTVASEVPGGFVLLPTFYGDLS
jgi:hypothetical protein